MLHAGVTEGGYYYAANTVCTPEHGGTHLDAAQNVGGLENLTGLEELPPTGAILLALPMKIEGGSGGPVRVVAMVPK